MTVRALRPWLFAVVVAAMLLGIPATAPPARAAEGLEITGVTTYTADPEARVIHTQVELSIENVRAPTRSGGVITNYYFTGYALAIHREATDVRASIGGDAIEADAETQDEYIEVTLDFGTRLDYGETFAVLLEYELPDSGPRDTSGIRVGAAFTAFYAYAYGENGAEVNVVLPPGYEVTTEGSDLAVDTSSDGTTLTATAIDDPFDWYAWVAATRPDALTSVPVEVELLGQRERIEVRAWPEDEEWAVTVADRLRRGVPILHELIGIPWPIDGTLEVTEADTRLLGGYAGFYERGDTIQISSDLEDHVILHEASHAWFNDRELWHERWLNEGFADEYAARVVAQLGLERIPADEVSRDQEGAFPLNEWTSIELITDEEARARIAYAYAASWHVVRELVDEIGPAAMRDVIQSAKARRLAYAGEGTPERLPPGRIDWRNVLDYLEETGGSEQASALFRDWVVDDDMAALLGERAEARAAYGQLTVRGEGWTPPVVVRTAMSGWQFREAKRQIASSLAVLDARDAVAEAAARVGAATSDRLETAYEGARSDLSGARALAQEQQAALEAIEHAQAALARDRDVFVTVGLLGEEPAVPAAAAVDAFEADDLAGARHAAETAAATIEGAAETGRQRVAIVGGAGAGVLLLTGVGAAAFARSRRRRRTTVAVVAASPGSPPEAPAAPDTLPPDPAAGETGPDRSRAEGREGP